MRHDLFSRSLLGQTSGYVGSFTLMAINFQLCETRNVVSQSYILILS